jgi:tRNA pseudouridine55 synthase
VKTVADVDGVLVIDKPEGLTSHDVVAIARRALGEKRIGHTGTLDPLATGVLPLACGRATRLVRFLTASDKDYEATIRFGITTSSFDITGEETSRSGGVPSRQAVLEAIARLSGEYLQTPPAYSAKKVGGRRAYDFAREDEEVVLTPVPVHVSRAELTAFGDDRAAVSLTSSPGFYVRTFAHELGRLVGTGACLEALRRTRSGEFRLAEALTIEALQDGVAEVDLIPIDRLLSAFPSVVVTDEGLARVTHGRQLDVGHYIVHAATAEAHGLRGPSEARDGSRSSDGRDGSAGASALAAQGHRWIRILDSRGRLTALGTSGTAPGSLHPAIVLI